MDIDGKKILRGAIAGRPLVTAVGADQVLILDDTDGEPKRALASDLGGGLADIVDDTTPQLGGALDVNGQEITGAIDLHSTGDVILELGDQAGTNKVSIRDSAGTEVLSMASDGAFNASTIDPSNGSLLVTLGDASGVDDFTVLNSGATLKFNVDSNGNVKALGKLDLGHSTDTTFTRVSAGLVSIEGDNIITAAATQTLTNKSIDSANNTITNIVNADIKSDAAIELSKLEDISQNDIIGRVSSGAGAPEALSASTVRTIAGVGFQVDAATQITPSTAIALTDVAADEVALNLQYTTNKTSGSNSDTGLLINQTDTASPGTSLLIDAQVGGVSKMVLDNAGRLVVATAAAASRGYVSIGTDPTDGVALAIQRQSSTTAAWYLGADASLNGLLQVNGDHDLILGKIVSGVLTEFMTMKSGGNVGIGLTDPQDKLEIAGGLMVSDPALAGATDYHRMAFAVDGSGNGTITMEAGGTGGSAGTIVLSGSNRAAHIVDVSSGTDTAYETAINAIIATLESHGLAATS